MSQYFLTDETKYSFKSLFIECLKIARQHRLMIYLIVLIMLVAEVLPLFCPYLMHILIDDHLMPFIQNKHLDGPIKKEVLWITLLILFTMIGSTLLHYFKNILTQVVGQSVIYDLRKKVFTHVMHLHVEFFKKTPIGRLMTRVTYDMDTLSEMFSEGITSLIGSFSMIIFVVIFMYIMNPTLCFISLAFVPLMLLSSWAFSKKMRNSSRAVTSEMSKMNSHIQESIGGIGLIQMFQKQSWDLNRFEKMNAAFRNNYIKYAFYFALFMPSLIIIIEIAIITVVGYGCYHIFSGGTDIKVGEIAAFPWYLLLMFNPFREISDKFAQLQKSLSAAERIFHLLTIESQIKEGEINEITNPLTIKLENISFAYNEAEPVLENINGQFFQDKTYAIVGATGSGKSTLVSLLKRHYLPNQGNIILNEKNITEYTAKALCQAITFVPQDIFIFSDTIAHNITLWNPLDQNKLEEVCRITNCLDFIKSFPQGFDTILNEKGTILSTGQRQLIAFARALYEEPNFLILDEATSNIDTKSELLIQDALKKMMKKTTMIIIAHRLSTIQHAHQILVLHKGKIEEQGNHQELFSKKGLYHKLCQMQFNDQQ